MQNVVTKSRTVTTTTNELKLDRDSILNLLQLAGVRIPVECRGHVTIEFHVPGGGDYSNMSLDINAERPIYVSWSEVIEEDGNG